MHPATSSLCFLTFSTSEALHTTIRVYFSVQIQVQLDFNSTCGLVKCITTLGNSRQQQVLTGRSVMRGG